jgi:hypothetical protein
VLTPVLPPGVRPASVEYLIDDTPVFKTTTPPFTFDLRPDAIEEGSHLLKAVAVDDAGRRGSTQLPFSVAAVGAGGSGFSILSFLPVLLVLLVVASGGAYLITKRRSGSAGSIAGRIKPFAVRISEPTGPVEGWPMPVMQPPPPRPDTPLGQLVIMDPAAIRAGDLDTIRQVEIGATPLTLGSGHACDVRLEDAEGRIAAEEARLWIQNGRLVYHKLTTLSAMATEGVTSGWQILEDGEEVDVGPYSLV